MSLSRALWVASLSLFLSGVLVIASAPDAREAPTSPESPARPLRIVALGLHQDEIALALAPDRVVAVDRFADDPEASFVLAEAASIGARVTMNSETILRQEPDLVLLPGWVDRELEQSLIGAGVAVHREPVATSVAEIQQSIRRLGRLLDASERAEGLCAEMDRSLAAVEAPSHRPTVLLWAATGTSPGQGTLFAELVERAGGRIAIEGAGIVPLSLESLIALDPEVILLDGYVADGRARALGEAGLPDAIRPHLRAARHGRIHALPARLANTTSHHVVETVRVLATDLSETE